MADVYLNGHIVLSASPLYVVPDEKAVIAKLVEAFGDGIEPISNGAAKVRPRDIEVVTNFLRHNFCGFGYHGGILTIEPLSIRFL